MICLVGDIITDITLATPKSKLKMRLGGIVHAARALWAMDVDYAVAYFAPDYMDSHIEMFLEEHNCKLIIKLGTVTNCPYTMLINEVKEIGNQGYDFLYHEDINIVYDYQAIKILNDFDKLMLISGNYSMNKVLGEVDENRKIYCDVANNVRSSSELPQSIKFDMLFVSTSSDLFKNQYSDYDSFCDLLKPYANKIVLKENRGGSRAYDSVLAESYNIPSQTSSIQHSVGVGDVYDVVSVTSPYDSFYDRLYFASWVAMEYAMTTFPDNFKKSVQGLLKTPIEHIKNMPGCVLPWEVRRKCHIYIAAPDFDFVDPTQIDMVCNSLLYHNFVPHRPIKENGQMPKDADKAKRMSLYSADMVLLDQCNMLLAVLLYNDPGTLIEIGLAAQRGIPTLVYDPNGIADNCMLTELPTLVSSDMDEIISRVFNEYSKQYGNGTL